MFAFIDTLLSRVTMYRLTLYYLFAILVSALALSIAGLMPYGPDQILLTVSCAVVFSYLFNWFFVILFRAKQNPESRFITALILASIMGPVADTSGILMLFVASFVAAGSKYILAYRKRHIFNPAAIGALAAAIALGQGASWWIGNSYIAPVIVGGGLLVARKVQRTAMVATYLGVMIGLTALIVAATAPLLALQVLARPLVFAPLFFFGFVMLLEPMTSPQARAMQYAYAGSVGVLSIVYGLVAVVAPYAFELALLSGNLFARIVLTNPLVTLRFIKKEEVANHTVSFWFEPSRSISFVPGKFMQWELPHRDPDDRGTRRFFTIASSPTEDAIILTTKFSEPSSTFKTALWQMQKGESMTALNVSGEFVLPGDDVATPCVFIAGGIGVTPFRSMIKYMLDTHASRPVTLLYSAKTVDDIAFKPLFDEAIAAGWLKAVYTITESIPYDWRGRTGYITADSIRAEVSDIEHALFYVSGPQGMVASYVAILADMGIPASRIKTDYFPGYSAEGGAPHA